MQRGTVFVVRILEQNISKRSQNTMNLFIFVESQIFFYLLQHVTPASLRLYFSRSKCQSHDFDFNEDLQFFFFFI